MFEGQSSEQQYCTSCGAEIRKGTQFCVSCGKHVREENEEHFGANRHLSNTGFGQRLFEAVGRYKELAQNTYEKHKLKATFNRYKSFFTEAQGRLQYFSDWWNQYAENSPVYGQSDIPYLLNEAVRRANTGHETMQRIDAGFSELLNEGHFREAHELLIKLRENQEKGVVERHGISDSSKSVLIPISEVQKRLESQQGWDRYKEEFAQFKLNLIKMLNSSVIDAAIEAENMRIWNQRQAELQRWQEEQEAARERIRAEQERLRRYPDPHKTLQQIREEEQARIAAAKAEQERLEWERRNRPPTVGDLENMELERRRRKFWKDFAERQRKRHYR